jgi:hypothetical protein
MGNAIPIPLRPPVPSGKTRICVAGFGFSHHTSRAQKLASVIATRYPDQYETWFYFSTFGFNDCLKVILQELPDEQKSQPGTKDKGKTIGEHTSSPFVWFETGGTLAADGETVEGKTMITKGGRDMFCEWAGQEFPKDEAIQALSSLEAPPFSEAFWFNNATPGGTWSEATKANL